MEQKQKSRKRQQQKETKQRKIGQGSKVHPVPLCDSGLCVVNASMKRTTTYLPVHGMHTYMPACVAEESESDLHR